LSERQSDKGFRWISVTEVPEVTVDADSAVVYP